MPSRPPSFSKPDGVAFLLAQVGAHAAAKFAERLESLRLVPSHAGILRIVARERGLSQQALAQRLGMFPSRLVLVLDEMAQAGLVERRPSTADRRRVELHLTPHGMEVLQAAGRVAMDHRDALCAALNASERETLATLLAKIAAQQGLTPGVHPGYRSPNDAAGKTETPTDPRRRK